MKKELIIDNDPKSPVSEAFRALRTNMQYLKTDSDKQTIVTTSTVQGEGKTWITTNLAVAFAQLGKRTLLIDSDMRVPRVHKIFEMDQYPGLSNYLSKISQTGRNEEYTLDDVIKYTEIKNLSLILAGSIPPNPSELLSSSRLQQLIDEAKERFDVIIFDGTPCLLVTDAIIISRLVGSTVIVTSSRKTKRDDLKEAKKRIENAGGHIVGVVLNRVKESSKKYESKYYYSSDKGIKKSHGKHHSEHTKTNLFNDEAELKDNLNSELEEDSSKNDKSLFFEDAINTNVEDVMEVEKIIEFDDIDSSKKKDEKDKDSTIEQKKTTEETDIKEPIKLEDIKADIQKDLEEENKNNKTEKKEDSKAGNSSLNEDNDVKASSKKNSIKKEEKNKKAKVKAKNRSAKRMRGEKEEKKKSLGDKILDLFTEEVEENEKNK